jgi:hypothetical protein
VRRLGERTPLARAIVGSKPKTALDVNRGPAKSAEPKNLALLRSGEWQAGMGEQLSGGEILRMAAFGTENWLDWLDSDASLTRDRTTR